MHHRGIRLAASALAASLALAEAPVFAQNLIANPEFDTDTEGWQFIGPGGLRVEEWSTRDWREPSQVGSLRLQNNGDADAQGSSLGGVLQCVPLPAGTENVRFRVWVDRPDGQDPASGTWVPELRFYDVADCFSSSFLDRGFATARGLPENRPWVSQEDTFAVPAGTLAIQVRLGTLKLSGTDTDPFVLYYDGVVLEPVVEAPDLRTVVRLHGEITSVNDPGSAVDPSIVPGVPLVGELVYDEAFSFLSSGDFNMNVPPGSAEFRFGSATLTQSSDDMSYRVAMLSGATDQIIIDAFEFDPSPALEPAGVSVTLTDADGSTLPDDPGVIDLVFADELSASRTFFVQGIGFNISGSFSRVEVGRLETHLTVFRASSSPPCSPVDRAAASAAPCSGRGLADRRPGRVAPAEETPPLAAAR